MEELLKALADPTRAVILDELLERTGQTLFEICGRLASRHGINPSRQAISQHLQALEAAGLVHTERSGRYKFHYLDTSPLQQIAERWPVPGREIATPENGTATNKTTKPGEPRTGASPASKGKKP